MQLKYYEYYQENNYKQFKFYSDGPKGIIEKVVTYIQISEAPILYNLGFGDYNKDTKRMDDLAITDNRDTEMVLSTVARTWIDFSANHKSPRVFVTGSTPARTRLYQICISKYFDEISANFAIQGIAGDQTFDFVKNKNYNGFLAKGRDGLIFDK